MKTPLMQFLQKIQLPPLLTTFVILWKDMKNSADEANSGIGYTISKFSSKETLKALGIASIIFRRTQPRSQSCAAGHFSK